MEIAIGTIAMLLGIAIGACLVWLAKNSQIQQAVSSAQAENMATIATYEERVQSYAAREQRLLAEIETARQEQSKYRQQAEQTISELRLDIGRQREANVQLRAELAREHEIREERQRLLAEAEKQFLNAFEALSARALKHNNESFLELARTSLSGQQAEGLATLDLKNKEIEALVKPLDEALRKVDEQLRSIEKDRVGAYQSLLERLRELGETQMALRSETGRLVNALRTPVQRGMWGEMQLRRVVELAGMVEYCDFETQVSMNAEGNSRRPDLVVRIPGGRSFVVDAKVPLSAYLEAVDTDDDTQRQQKLKQHASQLRTHMQGLASKAYFQLFTETPEFVIAFVPGESFLAAALSQDPGLLEWGMENRVLLSTPTTLISLLKTASYGWRQEKIAENARQISDLGKEMFERLRVFTGHFQGIRKGLEATLRSYNDAAGSLESRVLVSARRFQELGAAGGAEIPVPEVTDTVPRTVSFPEVPVLTVRESVNHPEFDKQ
jgi:DNA recombination protein RmuC